MIDTAITRFGIAELAKRLGVPRNRIDTWRSRVRDGNKLDALARAAFEQVVRIDELERQSTTTSAEIRRIVDEALREREEKPPSTGPSGAAQPG